MKSAPVTLAGSFLPGAKGGMQVNGFTSRSNKVKMETVVCCKIANWKVLESRRSVQGPVCRSPKIMIL